MKKLSLEIKSFFKSKPRLITFIAFFSVIIGLYGYKLYNLFNYFFDNTANVENIGFLVLFRAQEYSYYFFMFFILISYWLFSLSSKSNLEETLRVTKKSIRNVYLHQFIFLLSINLFSTLALIVVNLVSANIFGMLTGKYILHIILVFILNYFLTNLLAIIIGFALSGINNRVISYMLVVVIGLFSSDLILDIASTLYEGFDFNLYPVSRLLTIFTPNTNWETLDSFGVSLLPYRWEAVLLWIFFFSGFAVYKVFTRKKILAKSTLVGFITLSVVCATLALIPQSKVIMDHSPDQAGGNDTFYYMNYNDIFEDIRKSVPADFSILKYDMKLKVRNSLRAEVKVTVDDDSLKEYPFTLHHGFKVKAVKDSGGNSLKFEQDIDLVKVYPQNKTQEFTFIYSGFNPRYYSNMQGICLPGNSVYYPIAGDIVLYKGPRKDVYVPETVCDFTVEIDYYQKIYSNLKSDGKNRFSGRSNGFTMVAGFYDEVQIDGVNIIYTTLNLQHNPDKFKEWLDKYYKDDMDLIQGKTFILMPNLNQAYDYETILSDHFLGNLYALEKPIKESRRK